MPLLYADVLVPQAPATRFAAGAASAAAGDASASASRNAADGHFASVAAFEAVSITVDTMLPAWTKKCVAAQVLPFLSMSAAVVAVYERFFVFFVTGWVAVFTV